MAGLVGQSGHGQRPPPGFRPMAIARLRPADLPLATVST
jgi:hypothetical protein